MSVAGISPRELVIDSAPLTPTIFTTGQHVTKRGWQNLFLIIYAGLAILYLVLGDWAIASCYVVLACFFALRSTDLDLFAPMSLAAHSFGIYFLLPLSLIEDRSPGITLYILGTMIVFLILYLLLPRLNFRIGGWLGEGLHLRQSFMKIAIAMEAVGYLGFIVSTRLAGYSNPLGVFSSPLKYRFFMMVGGMTYITQVLAFLLMTPAVIVAIAYYLGFASRRAFWGFMGAGLFYGLATGSRGSPIALVIEVLVVRHLLRKRISITVVVAMVCVCLPFIAIAGQYRMAKYSNHTISLDQVVSKLDAREILNLAFSRLDAAEMFNELMDDFHGRPKMGESYLMLPVDVIPRSLWPSKPRLPNPEMTRIIGRNDPFLDIAFDFGIFGETYINFLWLGIIAGALILVVVSGPMQCIYEYAKTRRNAVCVLFAAIMLLTPYILVVSGLVETIIFASFAFLQVLLLRKIFFRRGGLDKAPVLSQQAQPFGGN